MKNRWSTWSHHKHHFIMSIAASVTCQSLQRNDGPGSQAFAYVRVHSRAVCMAACSSSFHRCATSFASGSSGFGAPKSACIERSIVRIWSAGDQLPAMISVCNAGYWKGISTLEHIEANATELVDIWVVYLCEKPNLRWGHRVVVWEK